MTDQDGGAEPKPGKKAKTSRAPVPRVQPRRCDGQGQHWSGECLACGSPKGGKCKAKRKT